MLYKEQKEEEMEKNLQIDIWLKQLKIEWDALLQNYLQECESWDYLFHNDQTADPSKLLHTPHSVKPSSRVMHFHRVMDALMKQVEVSTEEMNKQLAVSSC